MKSKLLFFLILLICALLGRAETPAMTALNALKGGRIEYADAYIMSPDISTRSAVGEEELQRRCKPPLRVSIKANSANSSKLYRALMNARPGATKQSFDLRWGGLFYDRDSHLVFSIYLDKLGSEGRIEGAPFTFDRHLREWFTLISRSDRQD
jgi:hypothetical protein